MEQLIQQIVNGLITGSAYALIALGLALIMGIMHVPNFALGAIYMIGAFIAFFFVNWAGDSYYLLCLPVAFILAGGLGVLTEQLGFRWLPPEATATMFIVALGMYMILEGGTTVLLGPEWRVISSPYNDIVLSVGNLFSLTLQRLLILIICAILAVGVYIFIMRTKTGKQIRAMSQNRDAARLLGISVNRMCLVTFGLGSALAAAAGAMIAPTFMVGPAMGLAPVTKGFVVVILGGMGSIRGAILGGVLLGMVESLGAAYITSMYKDAFAFGMLIIILLVRPTGLFQR